MIIQDKNQTLQPPDGFVFRGIHAEGAYLRATYARNIFEAGTMHIVGQDKVVIYLNDMGREVVRTTDAEMFNECWNGSQPKPAPPVSRRFRFRNGFLIALQGLQEMLKCLSK